MARKNIFDDVNDFLNTDFSGGVSTKKRGEPGYVAVLPFGEGPKKPIAASNSGVMDAYVNKLNAKKAALKKRTYKIQPMTKKSK